MQRAPRPALDERAAGLEIQELTVARDGVTRLAGVSLSVRPGEIVGVAGVEGNGQVELCEAELKATLGEAIAAREAATSSGLRPMRCAVSMSACVTVAPVARSRAASRAASKGESARASPAFASLPLT